MSDSKVKKVDAPAGIEGPGFFATKLSDVVGLARANSLWPLPFATSCCGIEYMATMGATYDLGRFGAERMSFFSTSGGYVDGDGNYFQKNCTSIATSLRTNGRA